MSDFNGILVVDKPQRVTSRYVVNLAQRWFPKGTRIGHTGTLDPLATGVIVLCVGTATRLAHLVQSAGKDYSATFRLGATSDTDDADGTVEILPDATRPSEENVVRAIESFVGNIIQRPPSYSAVKIQGKRSHRLARNGQKPNPAPRAVHVDSIRLIRYEWPYLSLEVSCGKGTYVRSLARDLGSTLGTAGLVTELRRSRVGHFALEQSIPHYADAETVRAALLPIDLAVADLPHVAMSVESAKRFRCGVAARFVSDNAPRPESSVAVYDQAGDLVGTGNLTSEGLIVPSVVLDRWK